MPDDAFTSILVKQIGGYSQKAILQVSMHSSKPKEEELIKGYLMLLVPSPKFHRRFL